MTRALALASLFVLSTCAPAQRPPPRATPPPTTPTTPAVEQDAPPPGVLPTAIARGSVPGAVEQAWLGLPGSENGCRGEFDYFPSGGMRIFSCHVQGLLSFARLQELAGLAAFRGGPHTREALDLKNRSDFGRYDPAFVRWLTDHLIPGPRLQEKTQPIYERYVRPLARIFYATYRKLHSGAPYLAREKTRYLGLVRSRSLPVDYYEKYFFFMNPLYFKIPHGGFNDFHNRGFDGGVNGNVVKTCVSFWIRRAIDGTDEDFARGLERLLAAYDARFLERARGAGADADWGRIVGG